jgi:hypothetical protein
MHYFSLTPAKFKALLFTLFIYLSVLIVNDGFMALDEYWVGIVRYIPAQSSSLQTLVLPDDVKSPLQIMPMHFVAQAALVLGVESPYWQYRAVIFVLGLISLVILLISFLKYIKDENLNDKSSLILLGMLSLYFAAPFGLTRPMFESVAAPWLTLAAVFAIKYDREAKLSDLLWGVTFVSVAFALRQQLGICALVFIWLTLVKNKYQHFLWASGLGLCWFILAGIPDYFLRGQFHFSLLNLTVYNYKHGSEYGKQSIFYYPTVIFVIALVPFFIAKYPKPLLKEQWQKYRSFYVVLFLFVFLHSLFPNKWERFLISLLPLFVLILFPYLKYLLENYSKHKLRLIFLFSLNGIFFLVASYFPAQKNLIEMSRYLDQHPQIKKVYRVANTPEWITEAFILKSQFQFVDADRTALSKVDWTDCGNTLVVGEAQAELLKDSFRGLKQISAFNVNLIEQLAFKFNPEKNIRRVQLRLYAGSDCYK